MKTDKETKKLLEKALIAINKAVEIEWSKETDSGIALGNEISVARGPLERLYKSIDVIK